jgi:hypothetical protein
MATVVNLIANTKTETGLAVRCVEDKNIYKKGIKISNAELAKVNLEPATFHGEWNYTIKSKTKNKVRELLFYDALMPKTSQPPLRLTAVPPASILKRHQPLTGEYR